ncbi:hypothetical protein [Candidatus Poriferisocius sp.]
MMVSLWTLALPNLQPVSPVRVRITASAFSLALSSLTVTAAIQV